MAGNKSVMLPEELQTINAVVCKRSELEHIAGMLEAAAWTAESDALSGLLNEIVERFDRMIQGE